MGKQLNTDSSAMIRLALYVALLRWDSLTIRCERHIEKEVAKFEKQIDDQLIILRLVSKSNENGVSQYSAIMKPRKAYKKEGT